MMMLALLTFCLTILCLYDDMISIVMCDIDMCRCVLPATHCLLLMPT